MQTHFIDLMHATAFNGPYTFILLIPHTHCPPPHAHFIIPIFIPIANTQYPYHYITPIFIPMHIAIILIPITYLHPYLLFHHLAHSKPFPNNEDLWSVVKSLYPKLKPFTRKLIETLEKVHYVSLYQLEEFQSGNHPSFSSPSRFSLRL